MIVVDYYSHYIEMAHFPSTSSLQVINHLKSIFSRWGIPLELISDNGMQFASAEFGEFSEKYGFVHTTSSPHYPPANGAAERAVQTAKRLLKQPDPYMALMCYRATPIAEKGASPAQLMMGRQIHTTVPTLEKRLQVTPIRYHQVQIKDSRTKKSYENIYNCRHSVRPLLVLYTGQAVQVKLDGEMGWKTPAEVVAKSVEPRSYLVRMDNGAVMRSNRKHLQALPTDQQHQSERTPAQPVDSPCPKPVSREVGSPLDPSASETTQRTPVWPATSEGTARLTSRGREVKLPLRFRDT